MEVDEENVHGPQSDAARMILYGRSDEGSVFRNYRYWTSYDITRTTQQLPRLPRLGYSSKLGDPCAPLLISAASLTD